jgi:hypothetical protein
VPWLAHESAGVDPEVDEKAWDDAEGANLTVWLRDSDRNRFRVDIETDKSYVAHDRLLRMWLCDVVTPITQRNPRAANRSRSFHCD